MATIPTLESLSSSWLTLQLQAAGHSGAIVNGFVSKPIGTGQVARCFQLQLDLAGATAGVPTTLVAKVPSDDALSLASATAMGIYQREVQFYRDVAPRLSIALPKIYFADVAAAGDDFFILMEDLTPAEPGDQLAGCSVGVARAAVMQLVGLQAPTWNSAELAATFTEPEDGFFSDMHGLYNQMLPAFVERYATRLAADELHIIQAVGASKRAPLFQPVGAPFCLEHRDYRLDNLMIDAEQEPPKVWVVDWQGLRIGRPLNDVALCMAGGLQPNQRAAVEEVVLQEYHEGLLAAGVTGFTWEQCWHEYRRASFAGFGLTVVAAMTVVQTARGDDMFTAMAQRYARHAIDSNAAELL